MSATQGAGAIDQSRGKERFNSKRFDAGAGGDDVRDRIQGADFVKSHILGGNAVDLPFRDRHPLENSNALCFDETAEIAVFDEAANFREAPSVLMCVRT